MRLYGAREGSSSVHLVLTWPRHTNSWKRDMWWAQDINLCECHINWRELDIMLWAQDVNLCECHINWRELDIMLWAQDVNLWERHIDSWDLDIMSWSHDCFCRGNDILPR